ncbi:hypothetical protein OPQ81_011731 [Rhizoctonia solani]|nr:hypothetical protein OPQ81_011731 [Rhizoctonia solani]
MSAPTPPTPAHRHVLTSSIGLKRKLDSDHSSNTTGFESNQQVPIGTADTNTPFRPGSAQRSKEGVRNSHSNSRSFSAAILANNPPVAPPKSTQLNMDFYLHTEMRGAIFCDPYFVENFLSIGGRYQNSLKEKLSGLSADMQGLLDDSITAESRLYEPILRVLQSIKEAVDAVRKAHMLGVLGGTFSDFHTTVIPGDDPDTKLIKPDLVLFEDDAPVRRRWETLMLPIEVKSKQTYLKVGMKQLSRYARAVFAHQIHRRHLYGMIICKWAATFVRFDRSGIVHSQPIDMLHDLDKFQTAFAGLMMLDRGAFGYDTAFTTEHTPEGLEYYVDLPAAAFPLLCASSPHKSRQLPPRKFKVMERLCHRKSINGRATIVLRLREVRQRTGRSTPEPASAGPVTRSNRKRLQRAEPTWEEVPGGRDYALKLMWRDPNKAQEGEVLKLLEGEYGVVQCQWYSDALQWDSSCHELGATSCHKCCDATPAQPTLQQIKNLGDLDVEVPPEEDGNEPQFVEVDTNGFVGECYAHRMTRIYTWALFSTVGRLLWTAESPRRFLEAILDSILGYWLVFNRGILHRDISDGNILIAEPGEGYRLRKWELEQESSANAVQNHPLAESRRLAQETIKQLGREPSGSLSDFDLFVTHSRMEHEFFSRFLTKKRICGLEEPPIEAEAEAEAGPTSKRFRQDSDSSCNPDMGESRGKSLSVKPNFSPIMVPSNKAYKLIDFRTGTPTFMSIRVLRVIVGERYEHYFMDDLESFFWLILWCVAQHTDPAPEGNANNPGPSRATLAILRQLDRADSDFDALAGYKTMLLADCVNGKIKAMLVDCNNAWANDQAIPETEFPAVIDIISEALKTMDPGVESHPTEV